MGMLEHFHLPQRAPAPELAGGTGWLNSPPLTHAELSGRVVLYAFGTYSCINWLRALPYVRAWDAGYRDRGLVVVGVHTPEFDFERDRANVERAIPQQHVPFPVVLDSDYAIWRAFDNRYWPALYLADHHGTIRYERFGEGRYEQTERAIQQLLTDAGAGELGDLVTVTGSGVEAPADWDALQTGETYLGYLRTEGFDGAGGLLKDQQHRYAPSPRLLRNTWTLNGAWTAQRDRIVAGAPGAAMHMRFHARDLHLVMAPTDADRPVPFQVRLDGAEPGAAHGLDADAAGAGVVAEPRMHQLVRQRRPIVDRTVEIVFPEGGAEAFVVTFG